MQGRAMRSAARATAAALRRQRRMINTPHGGVLVDRMVSDAAEAADLVKQCDGREITLSMRQSCDVELLTNGGFSPLEGFMNEDAYNSVVSDMKLPSGLMFSIPVVMDTDRDDIKPGQKVALNFKSNVDKGGAVAVMEVESKWRPDKVKEVKSLYGTSELEHPGVLMVAMERGRHYIGGKLHGIRVPQREFPCASPKELRAQLPPTGDIVVFQCRNPVHRAHYELFTRALDAPNVNQKEAVVLVHPTCGPTQADDIPGHVRYLTYEKLKEETKDPRVRWAYMPYSMHMAGPREAIQHMMLRKNFGCTHFIIGRDMAGSKSSITGEDYYGAYDAQEFAQKHAPELGIDTVPSLNLVYTAEHGYITAEEAKEKGVKPVKLSGTEFRRRLRAKEDIPEWFAFKSVVDVLRANV